MTAAAVGALAPRILIRSASGIFRAPARSGAVHRTGAPVRRGSREAGTFEEEEFFRPPEDGEPSQILRACRAMLDKARALRRQARQGRKLSRTERAVAALHPSSLRVLEELCGLMKRCAGRVFPSYDHLAAATDYGRATVAKALVALEGAGFLVRQARFVRVEAEGPGPRYEQTSNVYRPMLSERIVNLLPRWLRPAPVPDDQLQAEADRQEECQRMFAMLTRRELVDATMPQSPLQRALASLGERLDRRERESNHDIEPPIESIDQGQVESLRDA